MSGVRHANAHSSAWVAGLRGGVAVANRGSSAEGEALGEGGSGRPSALRVVVTRCSRRLTARARRVAVIPAFGDDLARERQQRLDAVK